ncbi:MAG: glycosyltransferase family 2 protein [Halovenus sp.]
MSKVKQSTEILHEPTLSTGGYLVGRDSELDPVLSVVMPTLDEEEGIATCIEKVKTAASELEVLTEIVVSDSSTDRTPEIAREMGAVVIEPDQPGYGYAYRYAFDRVRGEYVVMGDADTTYDFEEIPRLVSHLDETGADIVMGSRLEGEIEPGAMPALHKHIGNPLLTRFLNTFYGTDVSDAHSGFRVIRREALEKLDLDTTGMEFASEMIMEAGRNDLVIEEVPIVYHEREGEETLESFRDGWRHVRFMLLNAPGYLFSVPAAVFGFVGVVLMLGSVLGGQVLGLTLGIHTAILGSLLSIVGYQVGSLTVFSAVTSDPIRSPNDPLTGWVTESGRLEHGLAVGTILFTVGTVYLGYVASQWFLAGGALVPSVIPNILAFTAIVLGIQTVFFSFFLSMVASKQVL